MNQHCWSQESKRPGRPLSSRRQDLSDPVKKYSSLLFSSHPRCISSTQWLLWQIQILSKSSQLKEIDRYFELILNLEIEIDRYFELFLTLEKRDYRYFELILTLEKRDYRSFELILTWEKRDYRYFELILTLEKRYYRYFDLILTLEKRYYRYFELILTPSRLNFPTWSENDGLAVPN